MASDDKVIEQVLQANEQWAQGFDKPMKLGVKKKLTVLTCMDSRLIPEKFLGLDIGDAEIIRNGGGRVTLDVLRSMVICQNLLDCDHMLVIHHTDCGGQALFYGFWWTSYLVPPFIRRAVEYVLVRPIPDLPESVVEDVKLLRRAPHIEPSLKLYGLLYSTETGRLTELCRDEGGGLILTDAYRQAKEQNGAGGKASSHARKGGHSHGHVSGASKVQKTGADDKSGGKAGGGKSSGEDGKSDKSA